MEEKETPQTQPQEESAVPETPQNTEGPVPNTLSEEHQAPEKGGIGPLVGIIIIVAVLIIGGLYFWGAKLAKDEQQSMTAEEIANQEDPQTASLQQQSASDDLSSIEADVHATDLDNLDKELGNIDTEFSY